MWDDLWAEENPGEWEDSYEEEIERNAREDARKDNRCDRSDTMKSFDVFD